MPHESITWDSLSVAGLIPDSVRDVLQVTSDLVAVLREIFDITVAAQRLLELITVVSIDVITASIQALIDALDTIILRDDMKTLGP